eukprot:gnl/TRDRNA2_/TRDRNA2_154454_c0_seq1.p1 gnl/TRDRNA2_/TRDRNA2_154454_c0~~gnl/TRDRNA2_/TRDRNA2_154454_c0_seq1.p1  ORF type:complete len:130 (-),score=2.10 gnl/TRDRNA2_/TRDRNA2_154454_c0_seq1:47-436(-)
MGSFGRGIRNFRSAAGRLAGYVPQARFPLPQLNMPPSPAAEPKTASNMPPIRPAPMPSMSPSGPSILRAFGGNFLRTDRPTIGFVLATTPQSSNVRLKSKRCVEVSCACCEKPRFRSNWFEPLNVFLLP